MKLRTAKFDRLLAERGLTEHDVEVRLRLAHGDINAMKYGDTTFAKTIRSAVAAMLAVEPDVIWESTTNAARR